MFDALFEAHAARVRRRLAARSALSGVAIGLAIAAVSALGLYVVQRTGIAHPLHAPGARFFRPALAALALVGGVIGWVRATRRRPSDVDIAVFLDERFAANEAITTAVEARRSSSDGAARGAGAEDRDALSAVVIKRAGDALARAEPRALRLPHAQRRHAVGPLLVGALVAVALLPIAPPPEAAPAPGSEPTQVTDVRGLDKVIEAAAKIDPRDEAQRERLAKLAEEAKALREKARAGAPQREIQAEVARLAEQLAKEKASLGDGDERAGFEAAMRALKESGELAGAARALGDRDLAAFDREMQRLADRSEKESREKAKEALKKAADAARKNGAESVAKALEDQLKQLEKAEARSDELRALNEAMKDAAKGDRANKDPGKPGEKPGESPPADPKSAKALVDALEKALKEMTPEQRQRLAENLKKLAEQAEKSGAPNKDQLRDLADAAKDPEALAKRLKELGNMQLESGEAKRQRELGDAGDGLGKKPIPVPGGGQPGGNQPGSNPGGQPGEGEGPGDDSRPGPSNKTPGDPTKKIDGGDLRSKADVNATPGGTPGSTHTTRTGSRPGDTANRVGTGALGDAAPDEVGGVNRSDVPEEYRAHVGRYFQP